MIVIARAWHRLAPKLWAFLAGGLTPTILIAAVAWAVYTLTGGRVAFELDATLAALLTTAIATVAGWFKSDGQLAGLGWSEMSPKLLTLIVSSGLVTVLIAIASQLGFELPAWAAGLLAAVLPMIPGYLKTDTLNPDHAPLQGHHILVAGDSEPATDYARGGVVTGTGYDEPTRTLVGPLATGTIIPAAVVVERGQAVLATLAINRSKGDTEHIVGKPIDDPDAPTIGDPERDAALAGDGAAEPPAIVEPYPGSPTVVTYDENDVPTLHSRADLGL